MPSAPVPPSPLRRVVEQFLEDAVGQRPTGRGFARRAPHDPAGGGHRTRHDHQRRRSALRCADTCVRAADPGPARPADTDRRPVLLIRPAVKTLHDRLRPTERGHRVAMNKASSAPSSRSNEAGAISSASGSRAWRAGGVHRHPVSQPLQKGVRQRPVLHQAQCPGNRPTRTDRPGRSADKINHQIASLVLRCRATPPCRRRGSPLALMTALTTSQTFLRR